MGPRLARSLSATNSRQVLQSICFSYDQTSSVQHYIMLSKWQPFVNRCVMTQTSTRVQQTTEVVARKPVKLTPWAALSVAVHQDTSEMENSARVRKLKLV